VKALRLLPNPVFRRGLRFGVGATIEHRAVIAPMNLATVVDIGANVGQFSLLVRGLHPGARIFAFEPLADAATRFRRLFDGDGGVTLHQAAVAPARGTATMHVSAAADSSSLLPIGARQSELFPGTEEVGTAEVEAGPLDAFVAAHDIVAPALLKIDVQGFELEVLRGAQSLLDRFAHVYVEASFEALYEGQALADEVIAFLAAEGFAEAGRYNLSLGPDGKPVQADFLFCRTNGTG
jgi:FkbM family methyltransferase